jgi:hypothetical protein
MEIKYAEDIKEQPYKTDKKINLFDSFRRIWMFTATDGDGEIFKICIIAYNRKKATEEFETKYRNYKWISCNEVNPCI